jgi:2-phosphosulfolactate phosphatase
MQIEFVDYVAGARNARGVAVIIDVLRAASVACCAVAMGAERVIPVAAVEEALELKRANPEFLAIGERHGRKLPGFDCGNSPSELERLDLRGKTVVHTTHAGTQGLVNAQSAEVVLFGALVNAGAICRYVSALAPQRVSLVRMGVEARERSEADDVCAELMEARLSGKPFDEKSIRGRLRASSEAQKFFDPAADWAPAGDFEFCARLDRFDVVLRRVDSAIGRYALVPVGTGESRL